MDFIGKWKLKGIYAPTENGPVLYTKESIPADFADVFEENRDMVLEFLEDGTLNTIVEATGPYLEMAAESGAEVREDGYLVAFSTRWEKRDGKPYYNSELEGTVLDEAVDPFVPIECTDDGCLLYNFGTLLYERA